MKTAIFLLFISLPFLSEGQTKYAKWRSDSTRHHDSTFRKWDTSLIRLRKEFRGAKINMESSKSKKDSAIFNNILEQLLLKQRERDDKNFEYGRRNNFKN